MGELYNRLLPLGRKNYFIEGFSKIKLQWGKAAIQHRFLFHIFFCTLEFNTNEAILVEIVHYFLFMHSFHPTVLFGE